MSKRMEIAAALRAELESGRFRKNARFPSEYELAERFGVNKITANLAVNELVGEGWLTRGKRGAGTRVARCDIFPKGIIAFAGTLRHPFSAAILYGAQSAALARGYMIGVMDSAGAEFFDYCERLDGSHVKGLLTIDYGIFPSGALPSLYFDCIREEVNTVNCDNFQGGVLMMSELIRHGHRNILVYTRGSSAVHRAERLRGFSSVMEKAGIGDLSGRIFREMKHNPLHNSVETLKEMLRRFPGFTAVATDSDDDARRLIQAANQLGISFPQAFCITGFGNVKGVADYFPMATIDQHPERMGEIGCNRLLDQIEGKGRERICETLAVELLNRHFIPEIR